MAHPVRMLSAHRSDRGRRDAQRGETLIEILVTVVLMGFAFTAVLGALFTASATAALNRERSQVSVFLQEWAERVEAPLVSSSPHPVNYGACGEPIQITPPPHPAGWTATYAISYMTGNGLPDAPTFGAACPLFGSAGAGHYVDGGLQKISLTVTTPKLSDNLVLYKRDPTCPGPTNNPTNNPDQGPC